MGASNVLAFWSLVTIVIRFAALLILLYVAWLQFQEFKYKSDLQPLKRILFYIPLTIAVTNVPQGLLSWERVYGRTGSLELISIATVSNATGVFLTGVLLLLVYSYRGDPVRDLIESSAIKAQLSNIKEAKRAKKS